MHLVCAADGFGRRLRQADVAHLACAHQLGHGADRVLDRRVGVDAVLVVEVDRVDAEPLEAGLAGLAHVSGRPSKPVMAPSAAAHDAELGGEDDAVALALEGAADQLLVGTAAVHVGGVEEGDAELERVVDGRDRFRFAAADVEVGHAHAAEAEGRHLQRSELAVLHGDLSLCRRAKSCAVSR